jgi:hypothetical protein
MPTLRENVPWRPPVLATRRSVACAEPAAGRRRVLFPVAACSSLLAYLPSAAAAASVPTVAGDRGKATLDQVIGRGITLPGKRQVEGKNFYFRFPPGAKQGRDLWYTVHLDVTTTFAPGPGEGSALVSASTDGQAAAQVEFYPERRQGGRPFTSWDSVDVFNGNRGGRARGRSARVRYENVLQFSGVKAGLTTFEFEVETFGDADIASVAFGPTSGVYATEAGPVELQVESEFTQGTFNVGEEAELVVRVINKSPRPAEDVDVSIRPRSDHLFVKGPVMRQIEDLVGSATTSFTVGRTRPGELGVVVTAATADGEETSASVTAEIEDGNQSRSPWLIGAVIGALGTATALWLIRRKRQEDSK